MIKQLVSIAILSFLSFWGINRIHFLYQLKHLDRINLQRTHTENYVLDMDYQKNIKAQAYLMTPEQVSALFKDNNNESPEKWYFEENLFLEKYPFSYKKPLYLVIRIKNEGDKEFFGEITCGLPFKNKLNKKIIRCPKRGTSFINYAFFAASSYSSDKPGYPEITTSWENIYVEPQ